MAEDQEVVQRPTDDEIANAVNIIQAAFGFNAIAMYAPGGNFDEEPLRALHFATDEDALFASIAELVEGRGKTKES